MVSERKYWHCYQECDETIHHNPTMHLRVQEHDAPVPLPLAPPPLSAPPATPSSSCRATLAGAAGVPCAGVLGALWPSSFWLAVFASLLCKAGLAIIDGCFWETPAATRSGPVI
jgi:hypothetical protein